MGWRNSYEERKNTPSREVIFKYWHSEKKLPPIRGFDDMLEEERACFACGHFANLERTHIVALVDGGPNTVDNLHILCRSCHSVSEGNPNYWQWLTYMRDKEWKDRSEWIWKICEMNGVDMKAWCDKRAQLGVGKEYFKALLQLMKDNNIDSIPKEDCDEEWKEMINEVYGRGDKNGRSKQEHNASKRGTSGRRSKKQAC